MSPLSSLDPREGTGPLSGVTVLDLSGYIAGPYGCTLLADMGALVVKVEPPEGDNLRNYPSTLPRESRAFLGVNRNKRGIALDLKHPDGLAVLARMVEQADVLVHNFRPSVPARLGIDCERMQALNPRLIYCTLTGYGDTGPLKDRAGIDRIRKAYGGGNPPTLAVEFLRVPIDGLTFAGSGMLIANPPFGIEAKLKALGEELLAAFEAPMGSLGLDWWIPET